MADKKNKAKGMFDDIPSVDDKKPKAKGMFDDYDPAQPEAAPSGSIPVDPNGATMSTIQPGTDTSLMDMNYGNNVGDPMWARVMRQLDTMVRSGANALTGGLADVTEPGRSVDMSRAVSEQASAKDPYSAKIGELVGDAALAGGTSKAIGAATKAAGKTPYVGRFIPDLSRNTIPAAAANAGLTNAAMTTGKSAVKGELPDPTELGVNTAMGTAFGAFAQPLAKMASPTERFMQHGASLDDAVKDAAKSFAQTAARKDIDLTIPEAIKHVKPGAEAELRSLQESVGSFPKGAQELSAFDARRSAKMPQVAAGVKATFGPGMPATQVAEAAKKAIDDTAEMGRTAAKPYFDRAKSLPVTSPAITGDFVVKQAAKAVRADKIKMAALEKDYGGKFPPNSVHFLDAVKKEIHRGREAAGKDSDELLRKAYDDAYELVNKELKAVSKDYEQGVQISGKSKKQVEEMEGGILGDFMRNKKAEGQADKMLNVNTDADMQAIDQALTALPRPVTKGVIANRIDDAVSTNPSRFAHKAFPTPQSEQLAAKYGGRSYANIKDTIEAAKAMDKGQFKPVAEAHNGPMGAFWQMVRSYGSPTIARKLTDPNMIDELCKHSLMKQVFRAFGSSASTNAAEEQTNKRKRRVKH